MSKIFWSVSFYSKYKVLVYRYGPTMRVSLLKFIFFPLIMLFGCQGSDPFNLNAANQMALSGPNFGRYISPFNQKAPASWSDMNGKRGFQEATRSGMEEYRESQGPTPPSQENQDPDTILNNCQSENDKKRFKDWMDSFHAQIKLLESSRVLMAEIELSEREKELASLPNALVQEAYEKWIEDEEIGSQYLLDFQSNRPLQREMQKISQKEEMLNELDELMYEFTLLDHTVLASASSDKRRKEIVNRANQLIDRFEGKNTGWGPFRSGGISLDEATFPSKYHRHIELINNQKLDTIRKLFNTNYSIAVAFYPEIPELPSLDLARDRAMEEVARVRTTVFLEGAESPSQGGERTAEDHWNFLLKAQQSITYQGARENRQGFLGLGGRDGRVDLLDVLGKQFHTDRDRQGMLQSLKEVIEKNPERYSHYAQLGDILEDPSLFQRRKNSQYLSHLLDELPQLAKNSEDEIVQVEQALCRTNLFGRLAREMRSLFGRDGKCSLRSSVAHILEHGGSEDKTKLMILFQSLLRQTQSEFSEEEDLLRKFRDGDPGAQAHLIGMYQNPAFAIKGLQDRAKDLLASIQELRRKHPRCFQGINLDAYTVCPYSNRPSEFLMSPELRALDDDIGAISRFLRSF